MIEVINTLGQFIVVLLFGFIAICLIGIALILVKALWNELTK